MFPDHSQDVTYDHIWSKILQELTKSPARNIQEQSSNTEEQATGNTEIKHE